MTDQPPNPPAFPRSDSGHAYAQDGMTTLDVFAAAALPATIKTAIEARLTGEEFLKSCAEPAYAIAEAMLEEKARREA